MHWYVISKDHNTESGKELKKIGHMKSEGCVQLVKQIEEFQTGYQWILEKL